MKSLISWITVIILNFSLLAIVLAKGGPEHGVLLLSKENVAVVLG